MDNLDMLSYLEFKNVGPVKSMKIDFKRRINVITGDNGLGKTFILDVAWWMLTRVWPTELNAKAASGHMLRPQNPSNLATIKGDDESVYKFNRKQQAWEIERARPPIPGIIIYAQVDGGFSIWDPARNYWTNAIYEKQGKEPRGYVFTPYEVWNGVSAADGTKICKGIYEDIASWYTTQDSAKRDQFSAILEKLSPIDDPIKVTGTTRISVDDARSFPTVTSNYGKDVPIIFASSAIKRIIALAYTLLWNWGEHSLICDLLGQKREHNIIFLIDEVECHLHPKWQRTIVNGILEIMKVLDPDAKVQLIMTTHSPLVMASLESKFDSKQDTWNDIDYDKDQNQPVVTLREFEKQGTVNNWLQSDAFDIADAASVEHERVRRLCSEVTTNPKSTKQDWDKCRAKLLEVVSGIDPLIIRFDAAYLRRFPNATLDA